MIGRRAFLVRAAAATLLEGGCSRTGAGRAPAPLANPGLQLFTLREALARDLDGTLARARAIGFRDVEIAGLPPRPVAEIRAALARAGLTARSVHALPTRIRDHTTETLDKAKDLGATWVVCAGLGDTAPTLDDYRRAVDWLNRAAGSAHERGLKFAFRNDGGEAAQGGIAPYDVLFDTDASLVSMEMDVASIQRAGADPLAYFDRHPGRFGLLDVQYSSATTLTPELALQPILARREDAGVDLVFVGDDNAAYPFASLEAGYKYLSTLHR